MSPRRGAGLVTAGLLAALLPSRASAEEAPAEILWQQALVARARGEAAAGQLFDRACEAGSASACLDGAAAALEAGDSILTEELLRMAREAEPGSVEIRLDVARIMAAQGNLLWAARELQALEAEGQDVSFELGYCMHELGMHDQAAEHLERAAAGDEEPGLAALYAAASLEAEGRREEALRMARLAARDPDEATARAAEAFASALRGGMAAEERTVISAWGSLSAGYDSNPVVGSDDAPTHAAGPRMWLRAWAWGEPLGGPGWALGARVAVSRDQSFFGESRPFDFTSFLGQVHGRFSFGSVVPQELTVGYHYGVGLLDGGQGVEEDDLYAYNESHLGALAYSLSLPYGLTTRLRAQSGWSVYRNRARTGAPLQVAVGQGFVALDDHLKVYVEGGLRATWARSPQWDYAGPSLLVAASFLSPLWDLELVASYGLTWSLYPGSSGVNFAFDYTQPLLRRRDVMSAVMVELGRSFLDGHLRVAVRYRLTDSVSTIETYDYTRHVAELAISGGY